MMKRVLSLVLCLVMVMSFWAPTVQASGMNGIDDIYIDEGSSLSGLDNSTVQPVGPISTEPPKSEEIPQAFLNYIEDFYVVDYV